MCPCRDATSTPATGGICHLVRSPLGLIVPPCSSGLMLFKLVGSGHTATADVCCAANEKILLQGHLVVEDECAGVQAELCCWLPCVFGLLDCSLEQVALLRMQGLQFVHVSGKHTSGNCARPLFVFCCLRGQAEAFG